MTQVKEISVKKRDGRLEKFKIEKIHKVVEWAIKGVDAVSLSDIEINSAFNYQDGITTKEIHESIIKAAVNLISVKSPNYQYVASNLQNYQLRKEVWNGKNPPKLYDFIKRNTEELKIYDPIILQKYTRAEINKIDEFVEHERDFSFQYAGIKQLCDKYLIQNKETGQIYETPQFAYILIAMVCFANYKENRLEYVKKAYDYFSKFKINLPTPLMAGVRSTMRSYSSCCLIDVDDSMDSLMSSLATLGFAVSKRYGIGINFGRIRALNTPIRGGEVMHTGPIPFLKSYEAVAKSCYQAGLRGGSATINFCFWHKDIEDILVLKNNAGTDDNRVRKVDYCIQLSKLFYTRYKKGEKITLFSPHEVKDLYDSFGHETFDRLYEKYENDPKIKYKKVISAESLMNLLVKERTETGRIYIMNIDHCNEHGPWLESVKMVNLCVEVGQPVIPIKKIDDENSTIGVCSLSAINLLEIQSWAELEKVCDIIVRLWDELLDYQEYFNIAAKRFADNYRSLGIGITNLAALLAKNDLGYSDKKTPNFVDEWMERIQYYLLQSSNELAKEKGKCNWFNKTKYSKGILPIDTYKKSVDEIVTRKLSMDWEQLRKDIIEFGLRHASLSCGMPCESSSPIQGATNGIEPPRALLSYKKSKTGSLPILVPHVFSWKNKYTLAYDLKDNEGIICISAALQKYMDMQISTNFYYDYNQYKDGKLPDEKVIKEILLAYKYGLKCLYYSNTNDDIKKEDDAKCIGDSCTL